MTEQNVQELLQRYFDGATQLDEERELQRYFAAKDIPDALKAYRPLFAFIAEEQAVTPPAQKPAARTIRLKWAIAAGIAASVAVLFTVWQPKPDAAYILYVDGQRIYNEAAAVAAADHKLQMLAASMQKAQNGMATFGKLQESSQSLQQFDKISGAYRQAEDKLKELIINH